MIALYTGTTFRALPRPPELLMKTCKDIYNHYISVLFLETAHVNYPFADESIALICSLRGPAMD